MGHMPGTCREYQSKAGYPELKKDEISSGKDGAVVVIMRRQAKEEVGWGHQCIAR